MSLELVDDLLRLAVPVKDFSAACYEALAEVCGADEHATLWVTHWADDDGGDPCYAVGFTNGISCADASAIVECLVAAGWTHRGPQRCQHCDDFAACFDLRFDATFDYGLADCVHGDHRVPIGAAVSWSVGSERLVIIATSVDDALRASGAMPETAGAGLTRRLRRERWDVRLAMSSAVEVQSAVTARTVMVVSVGSGWSDEMLMSIDSLLSIGGRVVVCASAGDGLDDMAWTLVQRWARDGAYLCVFEYLSAALGSATHCLRQLSFVTSSFAEVAAGAPIEVVPFRRPLPRPRPVLYDEEQHRDHP